MLSDRIVILMCGDQEEMKDVESEALPNPLWRPFQCSTWQMQDGREQERPIKCLDYQLTVEWLMMKGTPSSDCRGSRQPKT